MIEAQKPRRLRKKPIDALDRAGKTVDQRHRWPLQAPAQR
jgi:hypothetical protein